MLHNIEKVTYFMKISTNLRNMPIFTLKNAIKNIFKPKMLLNQKKCCNFAKKIKHNTIL